MIFTHMVTVVKKWVAQYSTPFTLLGKKMFVTSFLVSIYLYIHIIYTLRYIWCTWYVHITNVYVYIMHRSFTYCIIVS